ncbi:MAG: hypothetical protein JWO71_1326 [Candidatus Acidoferrum typicum]|nr:hypothetical protein [Candidatus Acidoferrum typicum]
MRQQRVVQLWMFFFFSSLVPQCIYGQTQAITEANRQGAVWKANTIYNVAKGAKYEQFALLAYANYCFEVDPNTKAEAVKAVIRKANAEIVIANKQDSDPLTTLYAAAANLGRIVGSSDPAYQRLAKELLQLRPVLRIGKIPFSDVRTNSHLTWEFGEAVLARSLELGRANSHYNNLLSESFASVVTVPPTSSVQEIIMANPDFKRDTPSLKLAQGSQPSTQDILDAFKLETQRIIAGIRKNRLLLAKLNERLASTSGVPAGKKDKKSAQKEHDDNDAVDESEVLIDGGRGSVSLLSTFAKLSGNAELSHQIEVVGGGALDVLQSIAKYNNTISKMSSLAQAASVVSVMATFVGAFVAIAELSSGPDNSSSVLSEQIQLLSQQIAQLSEDMHARFDRLEQGMTAAFNALNENVRELFVLQQQVFLEVGKARQDLRLVEARLEELQERLDTLRVQNEQFLRAFADREFQHELADCLEHDNFYPGIAMSAEKFGACRLEFAQHGTTASKDILSTGFVADYDPENIATRIEERPITENLNYLAGLAESAFGESDMRSLSGNVASLREWSLATEAYIQLGLAHPNYISAAVISATAAMSQVGEQLQQVAGKARSASLFRKLVANYRSKVQEFQLALQALERQYEKDYVKGYDLTLGPKQKTNYEFRAQGANFLESCFTQAVEKGWTAPNMTLAMPAKMTWLVPQWYASAEDMELGALAVCFYTKPFSSEESEKNRVLELGFGSTQIYGIRLTATPAVKVVGWFRTRSQTKAIQVFEKTFTLAPVWWATIEEKTGQLKPPFWPRTGVTFGPTSEQLLSSNWEAGEKLKEKLEAIVATAERGKSYDRSPYAKDDAAVQKVVSEYLNEHGRRLYNGIADGTFERDSIQRLSRRVDGARAALLAFTMLASSSGASQTDTVRAMFFGKERLPGSRDLLLSYHFAVSQGELQQNRLAAELEEHGYQMNCRSFIQAMRRRDTHVAQLYVQAGIASRLGEADRSWTLNELQRLPDSRTARQLATAFRVKANTEHRQGLRLAYAGEENRRLVAERLQAFETLVPQILAGSSQEPVQIPEIQYEMHRLEFFRDWGASLPNVSDRTLSH